MNLSEIYKLLRKENSRKALLNLDRSLKERVTETLDGIVEAKKKMGKACRAARDAQNNFLTLMHTKKEDYGEEAEVFLPYDELLKILGREASATAKKKKKSCQKRNEFKGQIKTLESVRTQIRKFLNPKRGKASGEKAARKLLKKAHKEAKLRASIALKSEGNDDGTSYILEENAIDLQQMNLVF